jgi:CheY-like chemotaxis protein
MSEVRVDSGGTWVHVRAPGRFVGRSCGSGPTFGDAREGRAELMPTPTTEGLIHLGAGFVLVADDEHDVRESMASILRAGGYPVVAAHDGRAAAAILDELVIGVLVLDVRMPRLGGIDLLDRIPAPPPTLIVSADRVDEATRHRLGTKVRGYLQKPFSPVHLLAAVAAAYAEGAGAN